MSRDSGVILCQKTRLQWYLVRLPARTAVLYKKGMMEIRREGFREFSRMIIGICSSSDISREKDLYD